MYKSLSGIFKLLLTLTLVFSNIFLAESSHALPKHNFYLSICEIVYKKESQLLEITFRFFTDDLEKAIMQYNRTQVLTNSGIKTKKSDESISQYLKEHFSVLDKKNQTIESNFIGWETEKEVSWCYVEARYKNFTKLQIQNNLLTELFAKQKNLVYLKSGNKEASILLDIDNKSGVLTLE